MGLQSKVRADTSTLERSFCKPWRMSVGAQGVVWSRRGEGTCGLCRVQQSSSSPGDKVEGCGPHVAVSLLVPAGATQGHQAFTTDPKAVLGDVSDVVGVSRPPL